MKYVLILLITICVLDAEDGSRAKFNAGILFSHYNTSAAITNILSGSSKLDDKSKVAIAKLVNAIIDDIRNSKQLIAGLDDDGLKSLNRRYVGMSSWMRSINDGMKKQSIDLGNKDNQNWLDSLKISDEIVLTSR